jgi:glycosyltransferase involved in cell wall biosynthesis
VATLGDGSCLMDRRSSLVSIAVGVQFLAKVAPWIERKEELLPLSIDYEVRSLTQELLHRLHRSRPEARDDGMAVQVRVLDDEIAARSHEVRIGTELVQDVVSAVVGVEDGHDRGLVSCSVRDRGNDLRFGGRSLHIRNAVVVRTALTLIGVDRDHLAATEQVADRREIEGAATRSRAGFDDQFGPDRREELLVHPQIERRLVRVDAEPVRVLPGLPRGLVVELVELVDDPTSPSLRESEPAGDALGQPHARRLPNAGRRPIIVAAMARPLLSVVVPVYNGGEEIVGNVTTIQRAIAEGLPNEEIEVIVVSDGSLDNTGERLLAARSEAGIRVIHYDRNLGKGYAVKAGALASHGNWVALVDSDLDLDPASVPTFLEVARREGLDFTIGSKRHRESIVQYPRSRRIASWCYQQLNRVLFRLDVGDTQVGLKVFSRQVADEVVPLLLVKQFAFDLELLAVATALGRGRVRELPVRLEYRFTGSALRSSTVLAALWDTAAIFYRLRVLHTYQRKRALLGPRTQPREQIPLVSLIGDPTAARALDYERLELAGRTQDAHGELIGVLRVGARPAGNWVSAAVPFFAEPDIAAVVAPTIAPFRGSLRERVAAAVLESRLGGGSRRSGFFPGNVRAVTDYPAENFVVRRLDYVAALAAGVSDEELVAWLSSRGKRTIYTPDTSLTAVPPPLVRPHLVGAFRHARARGRAARRTRGSSLSGATALSLAPTAAGILGVALLIAGQQTAGLVLLLVYAAALAASGIHAAVRFRSLTVGALEPPAAVASQGAYLFGFIRGLTD